MKAAAMTGPALLALAVLAAAPARATVYDFTQLPLRAGGLNDLGQIVGTAQNTSAVALLYDNGSLTPLFGSGGGSSSVPFYYYSFQAINNSDLVAYVISDYSGHFSTRDTNLEGGAVANPYVFYQNDDVNINAVNNKGDFVGNASASALELTNGQSIEFNVPNSNTGSYYYPTIATGINDLGQIVGAYNAGNGGFGPSPFLPSIAAGIEGFLLSGGVYTTITVPGALDTYPVAINNNGEIVGIFTDATGSHGFEDENGVFSTIAGPGGGDFFPEGLNNLGQLIGTTGIYFQGPSYLATPQAVPEPSTLALLCVGLTGLLGWRSYAGKGNARR